MWGRGNAGGADLAERSQALTEALELGGTRLEPEAVHAARAIVRKTRERAALGTGYTIVALAGATGSGKSSLFNALVGAEVARPGVRRPTTSTPTAAVWGEGSAGELLDWLGVGARHQVDQRPGKRAGLVLLDLPDFDSREQRNRAEADRVLQLADVFVWVTDPQKYADAVIHEEYIRRLSARDARTIVVLNQADRLSVDGVEQTVRDLRRLLTGEHPDRGRRIDVMPVSAATGAGVDRLMGLITEVTETQAAAESRMLSDVRNAASGLREGVGDSERHLDAGADDRLVDALAKAAGVPVVLDAVQRDYKAQANARAGWPFTKWTRKLRPDPLKRLGLDRSKKGGADDVRVALGRSSLPAASPAQRSAIDLATRDLADRAAEGLPLRWTHAVEEAAVPEHTGLADGLDQAVMSTPLQGRKPAWWSVVAVLQWIFALAAIGGLLWLLTLIVLGWLQIHVETPAWGPLPYPTLLLAAGLLLGLLTTALMKAFAAAGAKRRRERVRKLLHDAISKAARGFIMEPVRRILDEHRRTRELLDTAAR